MYYSYQDQVSIVKDIRIKEDESKRIICPFCMGINSFTLSNKDGDIVWNCYRASCTARGVYRGVGSVASLRRRLDKSTEESLPIKNPIPSVLSNIENHKFVMDWLQRNNCLSEAIQKKVIIKYSPKERRVLFFYPDEVGALGRTLIPGHLPKWKQFGDTSKVFVAGTGNHAVLVEDCASAVSVSRLENVIGISISGTNLSTKQKQTLQNYNKVTIALDKDAARKSSKLVSQLFPFTKIATTLIDRDLKHLTLKELRNVDFKVSQTQAKDT